MIITQIHEDLLSLLNDWQAICIDRILLEEGSFVEKVKDHILLLDKHCKDLKSHQHLHDLIYHVLHTPSGAPVVSDGTILDLARDEKNSSLYNYLNKSLDNSKKENFLFASLYILDEKLKEVS